jgi:putative membrane protein
MKNKLSTSAHIGIIAALLSFLSFTGAAMGQMDPSAGKSTGQISAAGKPAALSAADKTFMNNAAKGGMMEVEGGKLAAQSSQNADVKKFGNRMVTDHSKANNELMALAAKKGVKLKTEKAKAKWTSDKDYMDMMVKDHEKDWAEFQNEAKGGSDPDLKKWAADTSKMIASHLKMAKATQAKLK